MSKRNMNGKALEAFASAWRTDPEFRAKAEADLKAALAEKGLDLPFDEVKVVEDTPETTHIVLTDPNVELSDEQLETAVGGLGGGDWQAQWQDWTYTHRIDGPA